jgi:RNA polymerase sigma factor (sigma-70 family)
MAAPPADAQLEDLVRRFSRLVRSVAAKVGGTEGHRLADDVEQEVFLSLWKQLQREQVIEHPSSYLYRSAVRETIRLLNRDRREETADEDAAMAVADQAPTPADRVASAETRETLADAIQSLPIDRRRAVRAYLAGFSVPELMKMYGWSYERARNLSTRGMSDLRAELRTRGIDG